MSARMLQKGATALLFCLVTAGAQAADSIALDCKKADTDTVLDFNSLNLFITAAIPPGTVLYSGNMNIALLCALTGSEGVQKELYFKRKSIGTLGYGLTLYTGYGGNQGTEVENIATGKRISACANGEGEYFCNAITLAIPFQIVKTSAEMTAPSALRNTITIFAIGSEADGADVPFYATNLHSGITVRDETCSVGNTRDLTVALGTYTLSNKSGLGSGAGATSPATAFNLLLNCEALLSGAFDIMMQFNGVPVTGLADKGVLALSAFSNAATNVGVQLLDGNKNPIALGNPFSVASFPLSLPTVKVPFYARYYQTGEKITAGAASSLVTYTISYQ